LQDAEKEFAEASATLALLSGGDLPGPDDLEVGVAPYLNGLAEAVGELRRAILDLLRRGDVDRSEELLDWMDAIYGRLVTIDYPDSLTSGLRRTTDSVRGILERTRGDLTIALLQKNLEQRLQSAAELMSRSALP
jgi:translin